MLLSFQHVRKRFDGVGVLEDISGSFSYGKKYALLGANGSGKTTLLNLISGFIRADSGKIIFKGNDIKRTSPADLARLGIARTFQSIKLFRSLTVAENLLLALSGKPDELLLNALFGRPTSLSNQWREKVEAILNDFQLYAFRGHLANDLSYGQQKCLHFAMATSNAFDLLLLDEPVAGLQPELVEATLAKLSDIGKTVLIVEHNTDFIQRLNSEVLFLSGGQIIARGTYDEIMDDPQVRESYL